MIFFGIYLFGLALHTIKYFKLDLFILLLTKLLKYMQVYSIFTTM